MGEQGLYTAKVEGSNPSDPTILNRLFGKIAIAPGLGTNSCWEWLGARSSKGYGRFRVKDKLKLPHRVCYELFIAVIPMKLELDHLCRNRLCCNPWHLEPVTKSKNMQRSPLAGKHTIKSICKNGHTLIPANRMKGGRCKYCNTLKIRKYRSRKKSRARSSTD